MTYENGVPSSDSVNLGSNPSSPANENARVSGITRSLSGSDKPEIAEQTAHADRTKVGTVVAAQWQLRAFARGKPRPVRDTAKNAIRYLRFIASGTDTPNMRAALAEKIEMLREHRT